VIGAAAGVVAGAGEGVAGRVAVTTMISSSKGGSSRGCHSSSSRSSSAMDRARGSSSSSHGSSRVGLGAYVRMGSSGCGCVVASWQAC
jgi:hypothetical protein